MAQCSKGHLSFLILWLVNKAPVLKHLNEANILTIDKDKRYALTEKGEKVLDMHLNDFVNTFYDIDEMKSCCCKDRSTEEHGT
jgi:DNA-binding PadR family transcriptional regulator